jgi:acetoin utilization protein AcuB
MKELENKVSSIMTFPVATVHPDQPLVDIKHIYEKADFHHHIPVVKDGQLVGMVSLVDFMRAVHLAGLDDQEPVYQQGKVSEIMSLKPINVKDTSSIRECIALFSSGTFHALPVTNQGNLCGIVSTTDILRFVLQHA